MNKPEKRTCSQKTTNENFEYKPTSNNFEDIDKSELNKEVDKTSMEKVSQQKSIKFTIPKLIYDVTIITLVIPFALYLYAHFYKFGNYNFYNIPADYLEVTYHDIISIWSLPLILLFIFLIPFYVFFIPFQGLEGIIEVKQPARKKSAKSKRDEYIFKVVFFFLMTIFSIIMLISFKEYWNFFTNTYQIFLIFILSIVLFTVQVSWNTKEKRSQKIMKFGSFLFSFILFIISTTSIAQGVFFQACKK